VVNCFDDSVATNREEGESGQGLRLRDVTNIMRIMETWCGRPFAAMMGFYRFAIYL
jgi:hypothetical protein